MSDQESTAPEADTPQDAPQAENETKPPEGEAPKFDADYVKSLRGENAQWRIKAQQAEERAQELEDAQKSEVEKAQSKASRLEQKAAEAEAKLLRYEVAAEKQIPADALDLLTGNTREELEARADKLLSLVKNRTDNENAPDFDGGPREPAEALDPEAAHNRDVLKLLRRTDLNHAPV